MRPRWLSASISTSGPLQARPTRPARRRSRRRRGPPTGAAAEQPRGRRGAHRVDGRGPRGAGGIAARQREHAQRVQLIARGGHEFTLGALAAREHDVDSRSRSASATASAGTTCPRSRPRRSRPAGPTRRRLRERGGRRRRRVRVGRRRRGRSPAVARRIGRRWPPAAVVGCARAACLTDLSSTVPAPGTACARPPAYILHLDYRLRPRRPQRTADGTAGLSTTYNQR